MWELCEGLYLLQVVDVCLVPGDEFPLGHFRQGELGERFHHWIRGWAVFRSGQT